MFVLTIFRMVRVGLGSTWGTNVIPPLQKGESQQKTYNKKQQRNYDRPKSLGLSNFLQKNKDVIAEAESADLALSRSAASVLIDHQYSSQFQAQETESNHQELPCTIWTQTETTKKDQTIHVARPEIAVEDI